MPFVTGTCSTYSKTLFRDLPAYPPRLARARGAMVWDTEGKPYLCWNSCLGAISLGYAHSAVNLAIRHQLADGCAFSLPHLLEEETAALLCQCAGTEQLRWCKNGSDATEAAVRLARHVSGHEAIVTTGYHGSHSDLVTSTPGKDGGVLPGCSMQTIPVPSAQDLLSYLEAEPVAAVVAEPVFADGTSWPWQEIKTACHAVGALLIFDEVVSGFRYRLGSALPDVVPDLYCFGKGIANGLPLACVTGPRELMQEYEQDVFFSSTAAAECLSLAACRATLRVMQSTDGFFARRDTLGQYLIDGCNRAGLTVVGRPPRTQLHFAASGRRDAFLSGMARHGHLLGRDTFLQASHTEAHVESFLACAAEVIVDLP
jgi:glutamate-1-semialdehyde 2,1-aminomutase